MKMLSTYEMCKILIEKDNFIPEDMLAKLDLFFVSKSLSKAEYIELHEMIEPYEEPEEPEPPVVPEEINLDEILEVIINE